MGALKLEEDILYKAYLIDNTYYGIGLSSKQSDFDNNYNVLAIGKFSSDSIGSTWAGANFKVNAMGNATLNNATLNNATLNSVIINGTTYKVSISSTPGALS